MGRGGGGQVVCMFAFYLDNQSLNLDEDYSFISVKFVIERNEIKQKRPFLKRLIDKLGCFLSKKTSNERWSDLIGFVRERFPGHREAVAALSFEDDDDGVPSPSRLSVFVKMTINSSCLSWTFPVWPDGRIKVARIPPNLPKN